MSQAEMVKSHKSDLYRTVGGFAQSMDNDCIHRDLLYCRCSQKRNRVPTGFYQFKNLKNIFFAYLFQEKL